jgi:hypothetical protein
MDISSISGSSMLLKSAQTQQALSTAMMKQAADQQNTMANMLAQNSQQAAQPPAVSTFSTFA